MQAAETPWLYWRADKHHWGEGKVHLVEEKDRRKTLCGKALENCPGRYVPSGAIDCNGCANALRARQEREKREAEWKERQLALSLEREQKNQAWQDQFHAYLQSEKWARKRAAVLERERHLCEACRARQATQVHHATYRHVFNEPLFELHAVCRGCHEKITELDRARRAGTEGNLQPCP